MLPGELFNSHAQVLAGLFDLLVVKGGVSLVPPITWQGGDVALDPKPGGCLSEPTQNREIWHAGQAAKARVG